jgi:Fe-S oxidoreductase
MAECFGCDICTQLCPADLSPADAIRGFRRDLFWAGLGRGNGAGNNGGAP